MIRSDTVGGFADVCGAYHMVLGQDNMGSFADDFCVPQNRFKV